MRPPERRVSGSAAQPQPRGQAGGPRDTHARPLPRLDVPLRLVRPLASGDVLHAVRAVRLSLVADPPGLDPEDQPPVPHR